MPPAPPNGYVYGMPSTPASSSAAASGTTQADVDAGRCRIIAPEHFLRETVGENVIAGYAMTRRALYQFGPLLPPGPRQHVDCGLGKAIPLEQVPEMWRTADKPVSPAPALPWIHLYAGTLLVLPLVWPFVG